MECQYAIKLLLERKANINTEDNAGRTPLSFATTKGHQNAIEFLKLAGAIHGELDDDGDTEDESDEDDEDPFSVDETTYFHDCQRHLSAFLRNQNHNLSLGSSYDVPEDQIREAEVMASKLIQSGYDKEIAIGLTVLSFYHLILLLG